MTLDKADRERIEELVATLEGEGANVEQVRTKGYDDGEIMFKITGYIEEEGGERWSWSIPT